MKKTSKRYVVSTSAVNCYGYRVLTEGIDYSQYEKNPILLWMHLRAYSNDRNQILPLGRAIDFKVEGDALTCALEFDETDTFAMSIYNKYENGTLNMLSLGAKPLEASEEPEMMLAGQYGPTFTKTKMTDVSCVDFGGNDDACACQLYDADDKKIELAELTGERLIKLTQSLQPKKDNNDMKLIQLTGTALNGILLALQLKDDATEVQVQEKVNELIQLSASQASQLTNLTTAKTAVETKLTEAQNKLNKQIALAATEKVNALVDGAVTDKKILPGQKEAYIKLASADFESTSAILGAMAISKTIGEQIQLGAAAVTELETLKTQNWDALHLSGKLERLKELDNQAFLDKRAEKYPVAATKAR